MKLERLLAQLSIEPWLVSQDFGETMKAVVNSKLKNEPMAKAPLESSASTVKPWKKGTVAVLPIHGPIFRYASHFAMLCGDRGADTETISRQFNELMSDASVKSIVLDINSPGGQADGISGLCERIFDARAQKKIVAHVGGRACSAGYWIASAASEIYIDESASLGSIGAVVSFRRRKNEDEDYETVTITSNQSPNKNLDPFEESGQLEVSRNLDALAEVFISSVARNRGVTTKKVLDDFGQGSVFVGQQTIAKKMADKVSYLEKLIEQLNSPAGASARPSYALKQGNIMDLEELKSDHPETYKAVFEEGQKASSVSAETAAQAAVDAEQARVKAISELSKPGFESKILGFIADADCTPEAAAKALWESIDTAPEPEPKAGAGHTDARASLDAALKAAEEIPEVPADKDDEPATKTQSLNTNDPKALLAAAQESVAAGEFPDINKAIEAIHKRGKKA